MEKILKNHFGMLVLAILSISSMAVSCAKLSPTALTEENLPSKAVVCGYLRYIPNDDSGNPDDPEIIGKSHLMDLYYGLPDGEGNVDYAYTVVEANAKGYFEKTLGCPPGKSLKVKIVSSYQTETSAPEEGGGFIDSNTYFYAEVENSVTCGKPVYFQVDMVPTAYVGDDGLINK